MGIFLKDPSAALDYAVDWGAGYLAGKTIAASAWLAEPVEDGGIVVAAEISSPTRTGATFAGGVPGQIYRVANRVTLSDGRQDERSLVLRIEQR